LTKVLHLVTKYEPEQHALSYTNVFKLKKDYPRLSLFRDALNFLGWSNFKKYLKQTSHSSRIAARPSKSGPNETLHFLLDFTPKSGHGHGCNKSADSGS
jgi:hypothetical protein